MATEVEKLRKRIKEERETLDDLKKQLDAAEKEDRITRLRPLREVAEIAHKTLCGYNHTDGCGWGYEEDGASDGKFEDDGLWESSAHRRWLEKVEGVLKEADLHPQELLHLITEFGSLKKQCSKIWFVLNKLK